MSESGIVHVTSKDWQTEVVNSSVPVLVDFWAQWCGPCRALAPVLEDLAGEAGGKIKIVKVDVDESQDLAMKFGIRSIPTLLLLKGETVLAQMVGSMNKATLKQKLSAHVQL